MMDFVLITEVLPQFFSGLMLTLELLGLSLVLGLIMSVLLAAMRVSGLRWLNVPAWLFTYTFRGTPLLVQIYLIYYGISQFAWVRDSFLWVAFQEAYFCALLALTLNNAAYTTEIFYNALIRLPRAELDACRAFGLRGWTLLKRFTIPVVARLSLEGYSNEVIFMLHATALVSMITLLDLTGVARLIYAKHYAPFEAFLTAAMFYLLITLVVTVFFRRLAKRVRRHLPSA